MTKTKKAQPRQPKPAQKKGGPYPSRIIGGTSRDLFRDAHDETVGWLRDDRVRRGADTCFLVGRGWSATPDRLARLKAGGFLCSAVKNYPRVFKPDLWIIYYLYAAFGRRDNSSSGSNLFISFKRRNSSRYRAYV